MIARLLAADPGERPASAREVLREVIRLSAGADTPAEVDLGVPYPEGDPLAGIFVGRRAERAALRGILDRLAEGASPVSTLVLAGAPGAGRRALFDVVAREVTVAGTAGTSPAVHFWRGSFEALALWLQIDTRADSRSAAADPQRAADARLAALAEALEVRARAQALCVWLDEDPAAEAFATWAAGAPPSGRLLLVVPARAALARPFADTIALEKLTAADVEALIAGAGDVALPAGAAAAIAAQSQGNAAIAGVLARRLIANLRAGRGADVTTDAGADLDGLLEDGYRALPARRAGARARARARRWHGRHGGDRRPGRRRGGRGRGVGRACGRVARGWRPTARFTCRARRTGARRWRPRARRCARASRSAALARLGDR